jgi:hypothetical protein
MSLSPASANSLLGLPCGTRMESVRSSETSCCLQITQHYNPEELIVCSHPLENIKSNCTGIVYIVILCDAVTNYMRAHS